MTALQASVRPAARRDLHAVAGIYTHYVHHSVATFEETPPPLAHWEARLHDLAERDLPFLVAESDGAVVGFAYAAPWRPKPAYRNTVEDTVYLAPDAIGRGVGTALLDALVTASARAGMRQMIAVIADTGDDASRALHRRFGFTDAGRLVEVGHKHGRWIDTFLMQRDLTACSPDGI